MYLLKYMIPRFVYFDHFQNQKRIQLIGKAILELRLSISCYYMESSNWKQSCVLIFDFSCRVLNPFILQFDIKKNEGKLKFPQIYIYLNTKTSLLHQYCSLFVLFVNNFIFFLVLVCPIAEHSTFGTRAWMILFK